MLNDTRLLPLLLALLGTSSLAAPSALAVERLEALEEQAFREAAALAEPSIVRIETVGGLDFVGGLLTATGPTTGVVVGEDGWIITSSFHFASKPASILVTTSDGHRYAADVTASDEARMLTLLKIDTTGLTPMAAAPQDEIRVGQWAIALGRTYEQPFPNISVGIVSALGRIWGRAIQTDAKVSPTNYGGPLVDVRGRAMGVLVPLDPQKSGETAGVQWYDSGIGFAIPMEDIYAVLGRLQSGEDLKPGRMGIAFKDLGPTAGEPVIDRVRPGSPAFEAGLQPGDRITRIDGKPVTRVPQVRHVMGRKYAGDTVAIAFLRDDVESATELTLAATLEAYEAPLLGILPKRLALSAPAEGGVEVRFVFPDSPAAQAGIERRDIITALGGEPVAVAGELREKIGHLRPGDTAGLALLRDGKPLTLSVTLGSMTAAVPDDLPSDSRPAGQQADGNESPKTGRWVGKLGDDEQSFWAYVPADYNPAFSYGLVLWLHPAGDTMEAEVLKAWQAACNRRGIILVGPKTSQPDGWRPVDADFVTGLVEHISKRYAIDPLRVAVHTFGDTARMAAIVAFGKREMFRGVSLAGAALRSPPPENHPEFPLQFQFTCGDDDPALEAVEKTAEALRELKFPVSVTSVPGLGHEYPSADSIETIARWIDALDRI